MYCIVPLHVPCAQTRSGSAGLRLRCRLNRRRVDGRMHRRRQAGPVEAAPQGIALERRGIVVVVVKLRKGLAGHPGSGGPCRRGAAAWLAAARRRLRRLLPPALQHRPGEAIWQRQAHACTSGGGSACVWWRSGPGGSEAGGPLCQRSSGLRGAAAAGQRWLVHNAAWCHWPRQECGIQVTPARLRPRRLHSSTGRPSTVAPAGDRWEQLVAGERGAAEHGCRCALSCSWRPCLAPLHPAGPALWPRISCRAGRLSAIRYLHPPTLPPCATARLRAWAESRRPRLPGRCGPPGLAPGAPPPPLLCWCPAGVPWLHRGRGVGGQTVAAGAGGRALAGGEARNSGGAPAAAAGCAWSVCVAAAL